MKPRVAILIVAHNGEADLAGALESAAAQDPPAEIHVWDNASRDCSREVVRRFAGVRLHESDVNLGFCAANNRLLALTAAPLVLFLNADARLRPGALARLVQTLDAAPPNVAAVGPKLIKPAAAGRPTAIDSAGIVLARRRLSPHDRGQFEADRGQFDAPEYCFGPSFACALWRREAIEALAIDGRLLDEDFFAYYEDVDVAWRGRRLGWRFLYEPRAVGEHRRGTPERHGPTLAARAFVNRYLMLIANEDGELGWGYLAGALPRELARLVWKTFSGRGFGVAWRMLAADWRGAWRKRRAIKEARGKGQEARGEGQGATGKGQGARSRGQEARGEAEPMAGTGGSRTAPTKAHPDPRVLDVIIVNHNTRDLLAACLRSVRAHPFAGAARIIVVDSASHDGSAAMVAGEFPKVEVVALPENRGFGHAANVGLGLASGETALLLNADTEATPGLLDGLFDELHAEKALGAVGPRHVSLAGEAQITCGGKVTLASEWARRQRHLANQGATALAGDGGAAWLSGSALMLKREALRRAGLFDERFALYFEDIDLCLRIGAAGFALRYAADLTVKHHGGASTALDPQRADYEYRRSQLLFWQKHAGWAARLGARTWVALRFAWRWATARPADAAHAKRVLALLWKGAP